MDYIKKDKFISDIIINKLGSIPIKYNGDITIFYNICNEITSEYPKYYNYINNYFIKNKLQFFKNGEYNQSILPEDCKSNSFLENYNKYLKLRLCKERIINWYNFITFLKEESIRSIDNLINIKNQNIQYKLKRTKFKNKYKDDIFSEIIKSLVNIKIIK